METAYSETAIDRRRPLRRAEPPSAPDDSVLIRGRDGADVAAPERLSPRCAGATLQEVEAEVEAFRRSCRKGEVGERTIFGRGAERARVVLIGDAATAEDEAAGAPFKGRAGDLLDRMLMACGLRETAYVTNSVFWRSPGDRPVSLDDQRACLPFLEQVVALIEPDLIVMVGAGAAKFLLDAEGGVPALRGRPLAWSPSGADRALPTFVTYSPELLLRRPALKKSVWFDFLAVTQALTDRDDNAARAEV